MNKRALITLVTLVVYALVLAPRGSVAQETAQGVKSNFGNDPFITPSLQKAFQAWNRPMKPFAVVSNIYYVGAVGVSSFLITTPKGHILLDTGFDSTVPIIRENMRQLGLKVEDIKILLSSHAHIDHVGGHAGMKKLTKAKIMMSRADAELFESGGMKDYFNVGSYPTARVDRILQDGDTVELGGTKLVCHLTPGHTKGCTTWTMETMTEGKVQHVLFYGSTTVPSGAPLVNNSKYPNIAEDYLASFEKLKKLPCDIFLAPHASFFGLAEKAARVEKGEKPNPFIDPAEYGEMLRKAEKSFREQLAAGKGN
ncbi:MAG: Metallo-beta-lactamase precursor [Verrucomicrobiales bacterium]|nr:Metallo-beta-lactamase precursor [Verrucomicrobiales bacterium]